MRTKKPFQLSRGCSIALVSSWVLLFTLGGCLIWLTQLPNDLGSGLGRGNRIANILVVATPGQRVRLVFHKDGSAGLEYVDKPGIFNRAREITLSNEERQSFKAVYREWCVKPPQRVNQTGGRSYAMGFSCENFSERYIRYIVVSETQVPPILLNLFERAAALQPEE